jgi:hypothetical protein
VIKSESQLRVHVSGVAAIDELVDQVVQREFFVRVQGEEADHARGQAVG